MNTAITAAGNGHSATEGNEDKRAVLIGKAARLMADKGYHQATMRDVSRATGYSLAGLYHYFASKEDLLFQLQQRVFSSLLAEQVEVQHRHSDEQQRVRALIHNHLGFYARHDAELKVCTFELHSLRGDAYEHIEALRRRYFKLMVDAVTSLLKAHGLPARAALVRHQVLFVFGALNWTFMWFDPARDAPVEKLGDELCQLFLDGLTGTPGQVRPGRSSLR